MLWLFLLVFMRSNYFHVMDYSLHLYFYHPCQSYYKICASPQSKHTGTSITRCMRCLTSFHAFVLVCGPDPVGSNGNEQIMRTVMILRMGNMHVTCGYNERMLTMQKAEENERGETHTTSRTTTLIYDGRMAGSG